MGSNYEVLTIQTGDKFDKGFRFCVIKGPALEARIDPKTVVGYFRTEPEANRKADELNRLARGGRRMIEIVYCGYQLEASAQFLASGRWAPRALISRTERNGVRQWVAGPDKPQHFGTAAEAEQEALRLAKAWVDQNG